MKFIQMVYFFNRVLLLSLNNHMETVKKSGNGSVCTLVGDEIESMQSPQDVIGAK